MGGEGRADAAPAQAKYPKRAENVSYPNNVTRDRRSAKFMLSMIGNTVQIDINAQARAAALPPSVCDLFGVR
jgi:hypothetical protein